MPPLAPPIPDHSPSLHDAPRPRHTPGWMLASRLHNRLVASSERDQAWDQLCASPLDILVIGGGITGAGVLHALSNSGLRIGLVEGSDFASGTSGRSSKLIHGGFRYLAQLEFRMVRKTALERAKVRRIAPHLTLPRWMVMPLQGGGSKLAFYKSAIWTYETLGQLSAQDRASKVLKGQALLEQEPAIRRDRYSQAVAFREYLTDDARLVLATLRAAAGQGAQVLNYARVNAIHKQDGLFVVSCQCTRSGALYQIRTKHLVNAAGPWVEQLQRMESDSAPPLLHLSKGIHIGLCATKVPIRNGVVLRGPDGRYLFALRRGPTVYVGTTDTSFGKDPKRCPEILRSDVRYLLDAVSQTLDVGELGINDVQSAWSGLRPLIADPKSPATSEMSRRDAIKVGPLQMVSVAGGKLSGYRDMAQQVCTALARLGCPLPAPNSLLDERPLPGGDFADSGQGILNKIQALHPERPELSRLLQLYGSEASALAQYGKPLLPGSPVLDLEVDWAVHVDGTQTLEDLVYRRLRLPWFETQANDTATWNRLAQRMGDLLGWSLPQRQLEVQRLIARHREELSFRQVLNSNSPAGPDAHRAPPHP